MEVVLMAAYQADCAMDRGGAAFAVGLAYLLFGR
jgi:hypothetical protein